MIKITLITLGKLKEKYLREACEEYTKRLSRYCDINIIELSPAYLPDNPTEGEIAFALEKEAELIKKRVPDDAFLTTLCVEGRKYSSEQLAQFMKENVNSGINMCFVIGSSYGIAESLKQKSKLRLSLSDMTFPHQLFRVMLLEQVYRGFKINEGSAYHK